MMILVIIITVVVKRVHISNNQFLEGIMQQILLTNISVL